jgi:hypothetical protein
MLRRTIAARQLTKTVQQPGPTLQGWGRTVQKRRLEYETVDNKYGKREFNKNWDLVGCVHRSTDYLEMRLYFNYPTMIFTWLFNSWNTLFHFWPSAGFMIALHYMTEEEDKRMKRAAWW